MKNIWVFLAHPDDEFFIHSFIARSVKEGHRVCFAYTTDGAGNGHDPQQRLRESGAALQKIGIPPESLFDLGVRLKVADGTSYRHLNDLYESCLPLIGDQGVDEVVIPAWEGGHMDHDTTHLLGQAIARRFGAASVKEFPLYNRGQMPSGLYRVLKLLPNAQPSLTRSLTAAEGWRHFWSMKNYPSQWKTFVGLAPEAFWRLVIQRRETLRECVTTIHNYRLPPQTRPLFYERRFRGTFEDFAGATDSFIKNHIEAAPHDLKRG